MTVRALLVGINDYPSAPLRGCVPDVEAIWNILIEEYAVNPDHVRLLLDQRATKAAVLVRLRWLLEQSVPGDVALFWFSGHGSQVRDRDGDELKDNKDELLVTADKEWWLDPLTDDHLRREFKAQKEGVSLYVVLDCCHSGSGTRSISPGQGHGLRTDPQNGLLLPFADRFCPPPLDIWYREYGRELPVNRVGVKQDDVGEIRHVLIAGCKADQTSADAQMCGGWRGALSYYFQEKNRAGRPLDETMDSVRDSLKRNGFSQEPQIEGPEHMLAAPFLTPWEEQ